MKLTESEIKNIQNAQKVAFRLSNLNSKKVTLEEIYGALIVLANFAEDVLFEFAHKKGENNGTN
jgi:hypothetical protein